MQNPNGTFTSSSAAAASSAAQYAAFIAQANAPPSSGASDLEGDLPTSLPSYVPPSSQQQQQQQRFDGTPSAAKRQATSGQWKTPPQFLFPAARANDRSGEQPSPSEGMRNMTFRDGSHLFGSGGDHDDAKGDAKPRQLTRQEIGGISAAQFAASTGGLTMDTALLARVSGTDPSQVGSEEIKQIMRTPDLLSIYQKLQEEDDRRQRRYGRMDGH